MSEPPVIVKCLVWDLDDTLWQGILLEDGAVHVTEDVRRVVRELDQRGILQAVASKNDHDLAWARLAGLGLAEYFVLPHIGWGPKSESVRAIADRLTFAHRTIAFVDDQPAERAEVAYHLPEVRCYSVAQVAGLLDRPEFSPATSTADSRRRRQMYQASFLRDAERDRHQGPDEDFLRSLQLRMAISRATGDELARVAELTLRTSQMNATGVHYDDAALRALLADPLHEVLMISMSDRFGPHGAVGLVLLGVGGQAWHLKLLATSCRVVSFGTGAAVLNWLIDQAARAGVHLVADFRATGRNRMMEIAYRFAGFDDQPCACVATAGGTGRPAGIQRLHLVAGRREIPATVRLEGVELPGVSRSSCGPK